MYPLKETCVCVIMGLPRSAVSGSRVSYPCAPIICSSQKVNCTCLFRRSPTCFICRSFIMSYFFLCSTYILPSFLSFVVLLVLPTALTSSQIASHIAFLLVIFRFLCCNSAICLFASSTNTSNSLASNFILRLGSLCSPKFSMVKTSNARKTLFK